MDSKERLYAIYSEGHGYLSNPRYDERDYMTCEWVSNQSEAYLSTDAHTLKSMSLDLDEKYTDALAIKEILKDKFVFFDSDLYEYLVSANYTSQLFTWNIGLGLKFEEIESNAKQISKIILQGVPIEQEVFSRAFEFVTSVKAVNNVLLETNQDDEKENLEENLVVLEKILENYRLAYEICGRTISK